MIPGTRTEIVALFALFACGALCRAQTAPSINTIDPVSALAGGPGFTMTVTGLNFTSVTVLFWNNSPLTPSIVSAAQLTVSVPAGFDRICGIREYFCGKRGRGPLQCRRVYHSARGDLHRPGEPARWHCGRPLLADLCCLRQDSTLPLGLCRHFACKPRP